MHKHLSLGLLWVLWSDWGTLGTWTSENALGWGKSIPTPYQQQTKLTLSRSLGSACRAKQDLNQLRLEEARCHMSADTRPFVSFESPISIFRFWVNSVFVMQVAFKFLQSNLGNYCRNSNVRCDLQQSCWETSVLLNWHPMSRAVSCSNRSDMSWLWGYIWGQFVGWCFSSIIVSPYLSLFTP